MPHIYYVAGEASGDYLAFWHSNRFFPHAKLSGVAGDLMATKMPLDFHVQELSSIAGFQVLFDLKRLYDIQKKIVDQISKLKPDLVVLVNFSSFNFSLAKKIKEANKDQKITFFSPPQLWIWGAWRTAKIKKYIDSVEVIFPFEVEWYQQRGIEATYVGSPTYEKYQKYQASTEKNFSLLCLAGSRKAELETTLGLFIPALKLLQEKYPDLIINFGLARPTFKDTVDEACQKYGLINYACHDGSDLRKLFEQLSPTIALTKPGTNTLELAFASIPTVVAYKINWLLYFLLRTVIKTEWTALPNLILHDELFPEQIQWTNPAKLAQELEKLLTQNNDLFEVKVEKLKSLFK